jgi:hypothetical protein
VVELARAGRIEISERATLATTGTAARALAESMAADAN